MGVTVFNTTEFTGRGGRRDKIKTKKPSVCVLEMRISRKTGLYFSLNMEKT